MKNIDVEIKNFGKIKKAKFQVKPFTVIAGKNASGKSFITRALYSIFSSLNKDHLSIEVDESLSRIRQFYFMSGLITHAPSQTVLDHIERMKIASDRLSTNITMVFHENNFISQIAQKDVLAVDIQQFQQACSDLNRIIGNTKKYTKLVAQLKTIQLQVKRLDTLIKAPHQSLSESLKKQLEQSFIGNFQVNTLDKLKNNIATAKDKSSFDFGVDVGSVTLSSSGLSFALNEAGIDAFQQIDNVVYLESPVYWKIKDVLKGWVRARANPSLRRKLKHQQSELKKIPDYILDTFALLDADIISNNTNDELAELTKIITQNIGGEIEISDSGDLQFFHKNELNENYAVDLHQSATGAVSLGIIALLLDKKAIVPNSVLIFDEPEVNLHPAWQQVMMQVLYKLSLAGVKVVMASHSFDMMETIEKLMDLHEDDGAKAQDHFSIVQLENGNTINHDKPIFKKLSAVKADLGLPLFNLFSSDTVGNN